MKSGYTYKNKFYYLIIASMVLITACYHFAFKRTIAEHKAFNIYQQQLSLVEQAPLQLKILEIGRASCRERV